jgi:Protein of unknown function (DUF2924)
MDRVVVLADGFAWNGMTYPSLSKVALAITGIRWNGPRKVRMRTRRGPSLACCANFGKLLLMRAAR